MFVIKDLHRASAGFHYRMEFQLIWLGLGQSWSCDLLQYFLTRSWNIYLETLLTTTLHLTSQANTYLHSNHYSSLRPNIHPNFNWNLKFNQNPNLTPNVKPNINLNPKLMWKVELILTIILDFTLTLNPAQILTITFMLNRFLTSYRTLTSMLAVT